MLRGWRLRRAGWVAVLGVLGATGALMTRTAPTGAANPSTTVTTTTTSTTTRGPLDCEVECYAPPQSCYAWPPGVVEAVTPGAGPRSGGIVVTLTGQGLWAATQVTFGETPALGFVRNPSGSITAVVPPGTGTVDVWVYTHHCTLGNPVPGHFTYENPLTPPRPPRSSRSPATARSEKDVSARP